MRVPCSTYRLQFNNEFKLRDAEALTDYLKDLGVTDLYSSPLFRSRMGSSHGYDVTDPTRLDPEIGTLADLQSLSAALQTRDMGLLLDIVPNHMAATVENPWWRDILQNGEGSEYASFFDVDWKKKLLLPVLTKPYGEALESGELQVRVESGIPTLHYNDIKLPITIPEDSDLSNPNGLDHVLALQPYRLSFWRKAAEALNYRRFFDVNDLVVLRVEREEVFRATHQFIMQLLQTGIVTGLRIDHVDGLRDPEGYLEKLPPVYVVVEKILAGRETLPASWQVWGTTGYDFLNIVNGLFVCREGYEKLKTIYADFVGFKAAITDIFRTRKRQVMNDLFCGEVRVLTDRLIALAENDRHARDLTEQELRDAFVNVTACLPVYRTYIRSCDELSDSDRYHIEDAVGAASRLTPSPAYPFLKRVLLLEPPAYLAKERCEWLDFVMRWQQFTGPVMAKGLEDTTFYIYNPLISVNEVGGDSNGPETYFGVEEFHRRMQERRARWPFTMNAGSTHDNKRSEDVRARINVLSEMPEAWELCLKRWSRWNHAVDDPDRNEQALIYQSMLGAWPIESERLETYVVKALREAKIHTSWLDIDEPYERRVLAFVQRILDPVRSGRFLVNFTKFQQKIAFYGAVSSLAQTVLRMTVPGVPDVYQGTEVWDYSLTDPDNRRSVDFAEKSRMLGEVKTGIPIAELLGTWPDGRIKMHVVARTLTFRRNHSDLFLRGDYIPLRVSGSRADNIVAFARRHNNEWVITIVPRLVSNLTAPMRWPTGRRVWIDTLIEVEGPAPAEWTNVLTGESIASPLAAMRVFSRFPFAVLYASMR